MSQLLDSALDDERLRECALWDEADRIADLQRQAAADAADAADAAALDLSNALEV